MGEAAHAGWTKPQLMAIVRMHGDEAVLINCKTWDAGSVVESGNVWGNCGYADGIACTQCSTMASS